MDVWDGGERRSKDDVGPVAFRVSILPAAYLPGVTNVFSGYPPTWFVDETFSQEIECLGRCGSEKKVEW